MNHGELHQTADVLFCGMEKFRSFASYFLTLNCSRDFKDKAWRSRFDSEAIEEDHQAGSSAAYVK